jgi:hypothetical protein
MFTIGIFSTHLPYVAFVFFYALFFLFGVRDYSSAEPNAKEKNYCVEILADPVTQADLQQSAMDGRDFHYYDSEKTADISRFDFKTSLFYPLAEQAESYLYCFFPHCRPPPVA